MSKPVNPFNPGGGVMPPYMAGRQAEIGEFMGMVRRIRDGQAENIVMSGLRGVGKTVLMNTFNRLCVDNGLLPVSVAQFSKKHSEPSEFAMMLKHGVRTGIETFSRLEKARRKFSATVKYIRPKSVGIPGLVYYEPMYDPVKETPYEAHLEEYLVKNWEIVEKSEYKGMVLLFDEFQSVRDVKKKSWYVLSDFIGVLDEVQKQGCGYFAVLSGLPALKTCIYNARSYTERMFRQIGVDSLGEAAAKEAIEEPLKGSKYRFDADLIGEIVKDTGGYPYFIQFFGREIVNNAGRHRIGLDDYRRIKKAILARLDINFYDQRIDALSGDQRRVLYAMSRAEAESVPLAEIEAASSIGKASLVQHLVRLEDRGVVHRHGHGTYRFSLPLIREHLRRRSEAGGAA